MGLIRIAIELMLLFIIATLFLAFLYVSGLWVNSLTKTCYKAWVNVFNWLHSIVTGKQATTKTQPAPAGSTYNNCDITGINCRITRENGKIIMENCEKITIKCR